MAATAHPHQLEIQHLQARSTRGAYYRHGQQWTPLYRLREASKLTQPQLAQVLGLSERTYRSREKTELVPSAEMIASVRTIVDEYLQRKVDEAVAGFQLIHPKPATDPRSIAAKPATTVCSEEAWPFPGTLGWYRMHGFCVAPPTWSE